MSRAIIVASGGEKIMVKDEKTSKRVGTLASKALRDPKSTRTQKSIAGSALTQRPDHKKQKARPQWATPELLAEITKPKKK